MVLRIRLTPNGGRDALDGLVTTSDGPALKTRVRAAPEDGRANAALEKLVANWLGIARRAVSVSSRHKSRTKLLAISGDLPVIEASIAKLTAAFEVDTGKMSHAPGPGH